MNGQLTPAERVFLFEAVSKYKPKVVLEVGTWKGGGSTWHMAMALENNGFGKLYTCETEREFFNEASTIYFNSPVVFVHLQKSSDLIASMIWRKIIPDFIFMDGPEDEETALLDLLILMPHLTKGTLFSMHDFDPPSIKAKETRPYLENSPHWKFVSKLTAPESVGICLYEKI